MALLQHSSTLCCSLLQGKPPATHHRPLLKQPPHPFSLLSEMSRSVRQPGKYNLSVHCQHPSAMQEKLDVVRRQTDFHPAVWDSHFLESKAGSQETNKQRIRELKEEVKSMLIQTNDPLQQVILVDTIENLGVAYHFDEEIQAILQKIYSNEDDGDDFHGVTLRFKLLRQHGYHVSSDVFEKFKEKEGNFNQNLRNDAKGLLSLYEASQYRLPGEDILDEALTFTIEQLKYISPQLHPALARHVQRSLSLPLQRSMLRLQARTYITFYEEDTTRNNVLLELAKLDFNHIQALHQDEIKELIRWWNDLELAEKVPFARDRSVESFMWGMDENCQPKFSLGRITLGKHVTMLPLIDEMFDMYGTLEELELLNDAIDRWDLGAMDQLPEYMKPFYVALYNLVHETDYISHENWDIGVDYLKKTWANYVKGMLQDARWSSSGHIPSVKEYLSVKQATTFGFGIFLIAALSMEDMITKENLSYIVREPKLRIISNEISRLLNDLATSEVEEERGTINSVQCYMEEHGVSKEEARLGIKRLIGEKWKELHQEALNPIPLPKELIKACINFGRVSETFYQDGQDGYSDSVNWMKDHINTMLVEPIPM